MKGVRKLEVYPSFSFVRYSENICLLKCPLIWKFTVHTTSVHERAEENQVINSTGSQKG